MPLGKLLTAYAEGRVGMWDSRFTPEDRIIMMSNLAGQTLGIVGRQRQEIAKLKQELAASIEAERTALNHIIKSEEANGT